MTGKIDRQDWCTAVLGLGATVEEGIRNLDASHLQIVLVLGERGDLVGTLTDGDIRRGLLRGIGLQDTIDGLINTDPLVATPAVGQEAVRRMMVEHRIHEIPVVDPDRRVVGLHTWSAVSVGGERTNLMVIMAGGEGRRLRPLTEVCPKPMLPIGGRPMLEHIIESAVADGFRRFVLAIRYLGHIIEDHFGDGRDFGVEIEYLREDQPLGTAGALVLLDPLPAEPLVVTNGDVVSSIRYGEMLNYHRRQDAQATMAVQLYDWHHQFGVVYTEGAVITGFEEKPVARNYVNAGVYVLEPEVVGLLHAGRPCDMPSLFSRARERGDRTVVFPLHEQWLDVGRQDDYMFAQDWLGSSG